MKMTQNHDSARLHSMPTTELWFFNEFYGILFNVFSKDATIQVTQSKAPGVHWDQALVPKYSFMCHVGINKYNTIH